MEIVTFGSTSVLLRVLLSDTSTGQGKTGLAYNTSGLVISTIADVEPTATAYTAAAGTIETIATLGTYAAPTATKCRFREVDATNHPGLYELHLANARFAVANARRLYLTFSGADGMQEATRLIELKRVDLQPSSGNISAALANTTHTIQRLVISGGDGANPSLVVTNALGVAAYFNGTVGYGLEISSDGNAGLHLNGAADAVYISGTDAGHGIRIEPGSSGGYGVFVLTTAGGHGFYGDFGGSTLASQSSVDALGTPMQDGAKVDLVDAPNATAVAAIQAGLSAFDPDADDVTVGDLTQAALAKFANTDTGEASAVAGSVAKLGQGSSSGALTDDQNAKLNATYTATGQISLGVRPVVTPVQPGSITVIQGDSYLNANGNPILVPKAANAPWPTDLAGWTITVGIQPTDATLADADSAAAPSLTITGAVVTATGDDQEVRFDLTAVQSASLLVPSSGGASAYRYSVRASSGSDRVTLEVGTVTVVEDGE